MIIIILKNRTKFLLNMASKNLLDVGPVLNRKASIALLDTAEELVDSLDNVAVCLKNVEERYFEVNFILLSNRQ